MKRFITSLLTLVFGVGISMAQHQVAPQPADSSIIHNECSIFITANFEPECSYDYKGESFNEYPDVMIVCKHSSVTYTAYANTGNATAVDYIWQVFGDVSHSSTNNQLTVNWGDDPWGMVIVSVVNSAGDTCTEARRVNLIDNPTVHSTTIPAYTVLPDGRKVIRVCKGSSIQFIDQSSAAGSDIAGYHWHSGQASPSSSPTYLIEDVHMSDKVSHRVYNNCGCYDEETIEIELLDGVNLELDCFGTVCENAVVTYHATSISCNDYTWYVEGGTIIDGQGTSDPVVQWDNPSDGYGVIGLDGALCGNITCPSMMSKKIPIIQNNLSIDGQSDVCIGEAVLFSLPLLGSTEYQWSITPLAGVNTSISTPSNEVRIVFNQSGIYQLRCTYLCDFLDCGPYDAEPLTIVVRPKFDITGDNQVCLSNACSLQTSPSVNASWIAYDLSNNSIETSSTGSSFAHTFSHPGRFLITAEHPSYCGPATFVLSVKDLPPAPSISDLDPKNRHTACPFQGIVLSGTPSAPSYDLVWEPTCTSASPWQFSGDSVTITYNGEVCDVHVYNYDRVLQCLSSDFYVHHVDELVPAPLNLPSNITVCPNSFITWADDVIPDQSDDGMLYEWTIEEYKQYCASVQGSHLSSSVTWAINNIMPTTFYVKLTRTYCNGTVDTIIPITVSGPIAHTLSIEGPDQVCLNETASFSGSGGTSSNYRWEIEGFSYNGNPASHTFLHEGLQNVLLHENPYTYCTNMNYLNSLSHTVMVNPLPMVLGLTYDTTTNSIIVGTHLSPSNYTFSWTFQANWQSPVYNLTANSMSITPNSIGTYSCTVTDKSTGCSSTVSMLFNGSMPDIKCDSMTLSGSYNLCSHSITLSANHYNPLVSWNVSGGDYSINNYGSGNRYADITFNNIGIYTVSTSSASNKCYWGRRVVVVDFIPDLSFKPACMSVEITNNSKYSSAGEIIYITVTNSCNSIVDVIALPNSQTSYTYTPSSFFTNSCDFSFSITGYGTNGNLSHPCHLATVSIGTPLFLPIGVDPVSISTSNPYAPHTYTCNNTPIELTATLGYSGTIVSSDWSFSDASSFQTDGNKISHTFAQNHEYSVSVSVIDDHGCEKQSTPITIKSYSNQISSAGLSITGLETCPYIGTRTVIFPFQNLHYWWWSHKNRTQVPYTDQYPTHVTDDYFVYVIDDNYCQKEASAFVKFKNTPTARIFAENFNCCVGDEITLYGEHGPNSDTLSYFWNLSGAGGYSLSSTDPNFTFVAPNVAGIYSVTLTVSNSSCSSTTTETISVSAQPPAPSLAFVGSPCISHAPVHLQASNFTGEMHWNNGNTGSDAFYFTPGIASAYYYDTSIGCPSMTSSLLIHKQPDFDALLTGCYEKCKSFFPFNLPVYSLTEDTQSVAWSWILNGSPIASGSGCYSFSPLLLPLAGIGDYQLSVNYNNGNCTETSPTLHIANTTSCNCKDIDVKYTRRTAMRDCHLFYDVEVVVCNNSATEDFCFDEFLPHPSVDKNIKIIATSFSPTTISPSLCYSFKFRIEVSSLEPSAAIFVIRDKHCTLCDKEISIDLMPDNINCEEEMSLDKFSILAELSSNVAGYFNFSLNMNNSQNLLALWSQPPMIIDYWYDGSNIVHGLGMVDFATLTQLCSDDSLICFYAITCKDDILCKQKVCTPALPIYCKLREIGTMSNSNAKNGSSWLYNTDTDNHTNLHLSPDPTTGKVSINGTTDVVVEVLILDLFGRRMASFNNTTHFDISNLPSSTYIVRILTNHDNSETVSYLKLIKR